MSDAVGTLPPSRAALDLSGFKRLNAATLSSLSISPDTVPKVHKSLATLPVRLKTRSVSSSSEPIFHYFFVKPHDPQYTPIINAHPNINGRSLFLSSIPFDATVHHLRALFTAIGGGRIEAVIFSDEPLPPRPYTSDETQAIKSKKRKRNAAGTAQSAAETAPWPPLWNRKLHPPDTTAVAVFVDQTACDLAMKAVNANSTDNPKTDYFWGDGIGKGNLIPELGESRYTDHYERMYPDPEWLQKFVDDSLEAYDKRLKSEEEERRRKANEPDEDGFITVVRSSRPRPPPTAEEIAERLKKEEKKAKKGYHPDFYRFQQRELKKEQAKKLLSQFEDAKRQVRERKDHNKSKTT
ncbi:Ribosomal RNA-processing protein 7 [Orbilia ellipsospora]|uniref:Ribosomal RNA-processing protein 7 n=1 Tax=Orbilia ellipsospora TaxID=2528407 RepID=A0AAV9XBU9_9PEZI